MRGAESGSGILPIETGCEVRGAEQQDAQGAGRYAQSFKRGAENSVLRTTHDDAQSFKVKKLVEPASCRLAVVASSTDDLQEKLAYALKRLADPDCHQIKDLKGIYFFDTPLSKEGKLAFLFPGEGSQYVNMLADLCIYFPEVRACFDRTDRILLDQAREAKVVESEAWESERVESERVDSERGESGRGKEGMASRKTLQRSNASTHISSLCHLLKKIGIQEDIVEHIIDVLSHEIPRLNNDNASNPRELFQSLPDGYTSSQLEGLARDILQQLVKTSGPIEGEEEREGEGVGGRYASQSPSPIRGHAGPKYVVLVGPTGTGKTTTIAKLSAQLLLKRKKKVGLITIDTYRVGAMEQLNTYAGIMNIPLKEASTFEQMRKAVLQYQDQDVVLIDTAGFSHHDREHLQLLNAFLAQVINPEIHLVLSTNTDEKELIHISQSFNLLHYEKLLFTKLDESSYPGTIFNHMVYTGKPISYITTGQKVPEDIELATQAGIINLMFQGKQFYPSSTFRAEL